MVTLISRAVGAFVVLGLAAIGFKQVCSTVWGWKRVHDESASLRMLQAN